MTRLAETDGRPATIAASPVAWNGMVFIGTSGAERACGCIVAGLDAASGRVMWTFALAPTGNAPGADTWPKGVRIGGGSVWTSLSIDTNSGSLYVSAGNPGPDFFGDYRPGANLFTGSVVVLDAGSGALRTWYQLVPHDIHDWDQAATPTLVNTRSGRHRAMAAGKDGYLHAIDTDTKGDRLENSRDQHRQRRCSPIARRHLFLSGNSGRSAVERVRLFHPKRTSSSSIASIGAAP